MAFSKGRKITNSEILTHSLFVDYVILFGTGTILEFQTNILDMFCIFTGMLVNKAKSIVLVHGLQEED
jgi:hypothetical protein